MQRQIAKEVRALDGEAAADPVTAASRGTVEEREGSCDRLPKVRARARGG